MPGRPGRLGFKGVPGPLGEKGKSILPPDEWKFKVYLFSTETTVQPKPALLCLMHKKRKSHDNSEILFERERRGIKVRQAEKEKMYFFLLM